MIELKNDAIDEKCTWVSGFRGRVRFTMIRMHAVSFLWIFDVLFPSVHPSQAHDIVFLTSFKKTTSVRFLKKLLIKGE